MMNVVAPARGDGTLSELIDALATADGSASHPYASPRQASALTSSTANLADAAHYLCILHGRHPGVVDHAATRIADNAARAWLLQTVNGFATERTVLTQVTVALGPVPSTVGQSDADSVVLQQRHALDMLAQSDRRGCAMGAAIALVIEWQAIRKLLDIAMLRVGIEPRPCALPDRAASLNLADAIAGQDESVARAAQFGAQQLLRQHRGLWDLLQARADVRAAG
jgi:hypothetical protein